MHYQTIIKLQEAYGFKDMQDKINSGMAWKLEGSYGREAMRLLESGACMLPKESSRDYYGNRIPSRDEVAQGSKGSFQNCVKFWEGVEDGTIEIYPEAEFEDFE